MRADVRYAASQISAPWPMAIRIQKNPAGVNPEYLRKNCLIKFQQQQKTSPAFAGTVLNQTELEDDYPFFFAQKERTKEKVPPQPLPFGCLPKAVLKKTVTAPQLAAAFLSTALANLEGE